jgi:hypothetical protein
VVNVENRYPAGVFNTYITAFGTASASSEFSGGDNPFAWKAFDALTTSPNYWASAANYTTGVARTSGTVTVAGGINYYGEWLQIQLPQSFVPTNYSIVPQAGIVNTPGTWYVFGSTDGSTWTLLDTRSGISSATFTNFVYNTYTITGATNPYNYYRIVCNIVSVNTSFALAEFNILRTSDFYADTSGNLTTLTGGSGETLVSWLAGATGFVAILYDQSPNGYNLSQPTKTSQPPINLTTTPYSMIFDGSNRWIFNTSVPLNMGAASFTLRYVVSNNTGGCILFKASGTTFSWLSGEKSFWLGNGSTTEGARGNFPAFVGNSQNFVVSSTAITASVKNSVVHKANATNSVPIYVNGNLASLGTNNIAMFNDPGNVLIIGRGGNNANYIGNIFEIELFSTRLSDTDRLALEN